MRATDAAGNTDPTPASQTWTIGSHHSAGRDGHPPDGELGGQHTAASTLTIPKPAGVTAGDVLVSCAAPLSGGSGRRRRTRGLDPARPQSPTGNPKVYGYYKVASGTETASYAWKTSSTISSGAIARYSGASGLDTSSSSTASGAAATSGTVPAVTTQTANAMVVGCMGVNSGSATLAPPSGMTEAVETTGGRKLDLADDVQATAGTSGAKQWSFSASREWAGWLVALRPI